MTTISVHADVTYPVIVEHGARWQFMNHLDGASRIAIIHSPALRSQAEALRGFVTGASAITIEIPDAEASKTAAVVDFCWNALGSEGFTRNDAIVSLGGGATTDVAGFIAATWLRGVRIVHIPTTLLAMVDASIGGKTGINTSAGKNLVGSFYSPTAVLCDLGFLASLPRADYVAGLAEIIKAGFIRDPLILDAIEADPSAAATPRWPLAAEVIARAIRVKADVVSVDMKEAAAVGREILNYGHTLGHAIERLENYTWRHGDAVSVGMVFAAELSHRAGRASRELVDRHRRILNAVGLPISYHADNFEDLLDAMRIDKKSRGATLRFVVLDAVATPSLLEGPDTALLVDAFATLGQA
jgi:3-dehydroquinate synthase